MILRHRISVKFLAVISFLILSFAAWSQTGFNGIRYQAVLRDASGTVLSAQQVDLRFTIYQKGNLSSGYIETHSVSTNVMGLINLTIGDGSVVQNSFIGLDWSANASDPYFLKVEFSDNGGTTFLTFGESQMLSVPYAMYAKDVENKDDADADPTNEIQDLQLTGNLLEITKKR